MLALLLPGVAAAQLAPAPAGPTCIPAPQDPVQTRRPLPLGDVPGFPLCTHVEQAALPDLPFTTVFNAGDFLFSANYKGQDGVGANLGGDAGVSVRFARVPRPDLPGFATRVTGPNGTSCFECHNRPLDDGSGAAASNVLRDPLRTGDPARFVVRNPPHLFGQGALQLLAEEMTDELAAVREAARQLAVRSRAAVTVTLRAKGIDFGTLVAQPGGLTLEVSSRYVDRDLVVRPFQWKGSFTFVREFVRDAARNEIGLEAEELVGGADADGDGVAGELTVGDVTTLAVYIAGQPPPQRASKLAKLGLGPPLAERVSQAVAAGERTFAAIGCTSCHTPALRLSGSLYAEPSPRRAYRDALFPDGRSPLDLGVDPARPSRFDLKTDIFPPYEIASTGEVLVELYSDLRRHDLGPALAEPVDEDGRGASVFLTRPLWGVGMTGPWLHDGRAASLTDAILMHGGEAETARAAFANLSPAQRAEVVEFLQDLVLFAPPPGVVLP